MKKRICSLLLICSMLAGLLPQIVLPQAAAADSSTTGSSNGFGLPTEEKNNLRDEATLKTNPYGTLGWVPLFQNHELVVAGVDSDEFQTTYTGSKNGLGDQMSTFRWSNSTDVGNAKRIATVAFDPNGTGKDEYIANLVFDKGAERLKLYVTNKDRRVSDVKDVCGGDSEYIKNLKFYQTRAMLCLTAGDFDGDGKDTLMVYTPGNNNSTDTLDSIKEYKFSGSTLSDNGRKINLGDVIDGGRDALKAMLYHDGNGDNELRAHLSVDMEVGDVDLDGIDELAMTVNVNDLKKSEYSGYTNFEKSYLTVYDYNNSNKWSQMTKKTLLSSNDNASGRARFAGVAIGNITDAPSNGTAPEVIAVGYYDKKGDYKDCDFDKSRLLLYSYQYQPQKDTWTEKNKAVELKTNGFTETGTKGDDVQNPIAVAAVAADGTQTKKYLFVSGSMYQVGTTVSETDTKLKILDGSDMGSNRGINGYIINNTGILDYAVGNFDGNKQGMEQVYYVEYHKQETFDKQFLRIGQLYKDVSQDSSGNYQAAGTFSRFTNGWTYYAKGNCGLALSTADVNNDAVLAKIESVSTSYTDPKIMAILESSPYFSEVNDGDTGDSATSMGKTKSTSTSTQTTGSFGYDVMAGFEYVAPIIESGGGVELNVSHTFTFGTTTEKTRTVEITRSNDAGQNAVIMYATPMTYYKYQVRYPDGTKENGKDKTTSTMVLSVAGTPATNMVSVDTYNEVAASYPNLQQIGGNIQLGTPGQPNTYRASLPNASDKNSWSYGSNEDWVSYSSIGTTTQSVTDEKGTGSSFQYEYESSVSAYAVMGGFKIGSGWHWGASTAKETMNTNGVTKEGAVTGGGDKRYDFNWKFATWTVPLNGNNVPVLGYLVKDVVAPPSPAQDLALTDQTTNSMVLSWESGDRPAEYYNIYRYIEENKDNQFVLVDTVDAGSNKDGKYEYTLTDLAPNEEYRYAITSGYYSGQDESVESEIVVGKTLANETSRPNIDGPNNITAQENESATFHVQASAPADYSRISYQWQQRLPGKKWSNISGATGDSYTVKSVTSDLNGAMYRCVVTCYTKSITPIPFYSDAATLTVGTPQAKAALSVTGYKTGSGTQDAPYIGQSDFNTISTETISGTKTVPYTAETAGKLTLNVYKVNSGAGYVGIGEETEEGGSVTTVYYDVTKNGDTGDKFTAGSKLTMSTTYAWKSGSTEVTVPTGTTPDMVQTDGNNNAKVLDTAYKAATYDESKYSVGEQYMIHGEDTVKDGETDVKRYILSKMVKDTTSAGGDDTKQEDTYTLKYYQLIQKTAGAELTELTYTETSTLGSYTNPTFTLETKEEQVQNTITTATPDRGTELKLTTTTTKDSGTAALGSTATLGNVEYTLTITNTSNGTVSTLSGKTNSSGTDTKTWTAPAAGLYAITTTTTGGAASATQYYLAGVQTVQAGAATTTETVYTLESDISGEYGTPISLAVKQQTVTKTGNDVTATGKTAITDGVTYKYRLSGQPEGSETAVNGTSFLAPKAGTYIVSAYKRDGTKIASTTITIKRKPLELYVTWQGDENHNSTEAPDNKSAFRVEANGLLTGDSLPTAAITAVCDLYNATGSRKDVSGRFELNIAVDGEDTAVKALLEKYELNLTSRILVVKQNTLAVTFSAGEGGTLIARYGENNQQFTSGKNIPSGTKLVFDAKNKPGYLVKEWTVNDKTVAKDNATYKITDITENGKTVGERLTVNALSDKLDVKVQFSSDSHTITFSSGEGGKLTAALGDGGAVTTGQAVAEGADVTFTAVPDNGKVVAGWTVDGDPYYWQDTSDLYREKTLTLKNIEKNHTVSVSFSNATTHKVTFTYVNESGTAIGEQQTSAKLADGTAANLNAIPDGAAVTFALENLNDNYTVKEWQVDGTAAVGSGAKTSFTLRNITKDHTVKIVISAAQAAKITFKAVDANNVEITDTNIASVTAKIGSTAISSGDTIPAYIEVTFTAAVGEDYYVSGWKNAAQDAQDANKAVLTGWNTDTAVEVTVLEKPQIAFGNAENGTITVEGTRLNEVTLTKDSQDTHVDHDSAITVKAEPAAGYYVKSIAVGGKTFDYDSQSSYQPGAREETIENITADTTVTAAFGKKPIIVFEGTKAKLEAQDISLTSGGYVEKYLNPLKLLATPEFGYELTAWTVNGNAIASGIEQKPEEKQLYKLNGPITADQTIVVTATEIPQHNFTLSVDSLGAEGDGGTVSAEITRKGMSAYERKNLEAGTHSFYRDSDITITAVPNAGYRVQDWTINGQTTADTAASKMLYNLQDETTVQVRFVKLVSGITFGPTDSSSEGGYLTEVTANGKSILKDAAAGANIAERVPIEFTAEVKPGYEIEGWYVNNVRDDSAGTLTTYTYPNTTSASSIYIAPKFRQVEYDITTGDNVTVNGQNRTTARGGESLTFTAVPPAGQNVTGWTVNGETVQGSGNTLTWTVENGYLTQPNVKVYHVEAQFSAGEYEVTYSQPANGMLTASVESGEQVSGGTQVTFTAQPDEGYEVDTWMVNGASVQTGGNRYTLNVTGNSEVAVTFKQMMKVTAAVDGRPGSIAITANGKTITDGWVSSGADVTFTVTPENKDDMVQQWTVNGTKVSEMTDTADAPLTWTVQNVTANTNVTATLIERPTYTVTVTANGSGTASAEPASVKRGGSTTVTAVPSSNSYYLKHWLVDGVQQSASGNTLTLNELRKNTSVTAVFDGAINYDVTLDVQGAETGTTVAATANGRSINPGKTSPVSVVQGSKLVFTAAPAMESADKDKQMVAKWTVNGNVQDNITNVLTIPSLTGKTNVKVEFVPYEGFVIPASDTNWTVSVVKRTPDDTKPATESRKNGTVTFTMMPVDKRLFRKLIIGGVDCMALPTTGNVTAVKNGAAYTITVKDVTSAITVDAEAVEYQVASSTLSDVPTALKGTFDSLDKLKSALRSKVNSAVTEANTAYLDIVLQYKSGMDWVTVTNPADFPEGGIDVKVLYSMLSATNAPNSSYNFSVVHMFTTDMSGKTVGDTETLTPTKLDDGITFHVSSLSPFAIGWYKSTAPTPGGGGGGGGGAVAPTTYDIVIPSALANTVKADKTKAAAGDTVTLTAAGEGTLTVTDANGKTVALTDLGSGKYTFKMPSAKVNVGFKTAADQPCDGGKDCPSAPFTDVDTAKWYHLSVDYVLTHKMMNGVSSHAFAPNANLTRGMLVQILYNLEGKPKGTAANFSDVQADAWYAEAVGWAASNKVVTGYADGTFRPNAAVTREQAAAILYRYAQSKGIDVSVGENTNILSYVDVQQASEYAIPALQWAVGAGVLNGKNGSRLAPTGTATRAEIAAIMQRWCENIIK